MYRLILALITTFTLISSCKTPAATSTTALNSPEIVLFKKIEAASLDYKWFAAKAKVTIESENLSGRGRMNIRMKKDSLVWFNFKKISIEGLRGIINPQGFTLLYRTKNIFEKGKLHDLDQKYHLPLTFIEIQNFLSGGLPLPYPSTIIYKKEKFYHMISGRNKDYKIEYKFDAQLNLEKYVMTDQQNRTLLVNLSKKDEELGIYKNRKLTYYNHNKKLGILEMDLSNIEINVPKKMPFTIPEHYTEY
ncbi:MAG: DUF4292 domain-containing protein [Saprospiraceae bacterium]